MANYLKYSNFYTCKRMFILYCLGLYIPAHYKSMIEELNDFFDENVNLMTQENTTLNTTVFVKFNKTGKQIFSLITGKHYDYNEIVLSVEYNIKCNEYLARNNHQYLIYEDMKAISTCILKRRNIDFENIY